MHETSSTSKRLVAIIGLVIIVAAIGAGVAMTAGTKKSVASQATSATLSPQTATNSPAASSAVAGATTEPAAYKDGTYTATGTYNSPGGQETIGVSVTLKGGLVADTTATAGASDSTSKLYQQQFIGGYKTMVAGKKLDDVNLSKVSGSSLTSAGFNDAIGQIKTRAHS